MDYLKFLTSSPLHDDVGELDSHVLRARNAFSFSRFFSFIRRFWNQILTWASCSFRFEAISVRLVRLTYFAVWNSFSSSVSWCVVKLVRFVPFSSITFFFGAAGLCDRFVCIHLYVLCCDAVTPVGSSAEEFEDLLAGGESPEAVTGGDTWPFPIM